MRTANIRRAVVPVLALLTAAAVADARPGRGRGPFHRRGPRLRQPAVVVTVMNRAPENGTFQTPVWVALHDGEGFDTHDVGSLASALPVEGSTALERIAEDGNAGPLMEDFASLEPDGLQDVIRSRGAAPPFGPGMTASRLYEIDPGEHRYFSYTSMVIPSNDAFVANDDPKAHPLFDHRGRFVAGRFAVPGDGVKDAGTEENDEVPENTAFFGQATPDTGVTTEDPVAAHPGFLAAGSGGILDDPMFADADFLAPGYDTLGFRLTLIDLARPLHFRARLDAAQEVRDPPVESDGRGRARLVVLRDGTLLGVVVVFRDLTGPLAAAHLHVGPRGSNGPIVVDLGPHVIVSRPDGRGVIFARVRNEDVTGPLGDAEEPFRALLAELVGGNIYVNVHTAEFPGGEIRGQVMFRR